MLMLLFLPDRQAHHQAKTEGGDEKRMGDHELKRSRM
jgi:hypothetical protein